jgi:uncharacterized protein
MSRTRAFVVTAALLAAYNVARAFDAVTSFEPFAVWLLVGVVALTARSAAMTPADLGLGRQDARRGLAIGLLAFLAISTVLVVVAVIPATRDFLDDDRADVSTAGLIYEVFVTVVLVTVLPEEFCFRGMLLGSVLDSWGARRATLASSALFGLWHISPTLHTLSENEQLHDATTSTAGEAALVVGSVAATFVAGLFFSWLRLRSRHLLAPVLAHVATNATAFVLAWLVVR